MRVRHMCSVLTAREGDEAEQYWATVCAVRGGPSALRAAACRYNTLIPNGQSLQEVGFQQDLASWEATITQGWQGRGRARNASPVRGRDPTRGGREDGSRPPWGASGRGQPRHVAYARRPPQAAAARVVWTTRASASAAHARSFVSRDQLLRFTPFFALRRRHGRCEFHRHHIRTATTRSISLPTR